MIKAVLFDLDATITDRDASIRKFADPFARHFASECGCIAYGDALEIGKLRDDGYKPRRELCGDILQMLAWTKPPSVDALLEFWLSEFPKSAVAVDGLEDVLEALKGRGISLGLVTNGESLSQNTKIDVMGIRAYFGSILISEVEGISKPGAAIFLRALAQLGAQPSDAMFVGDNPAIDIVGAAGAAGAGIATVWVRNGRVWPEGLAAPTYAIDSLRELLGLVG